MGDDHRRGGEKYLQFAFGKIVISLREEIGRNIYGVIIVQANGYILIGGKSSRMKTSKFALCLGGATFAERALFALRKVADNRVCFVTGVNQKPETNKVLPPDVPQIADICPDKAAIGGLHTALAHSSGEWTAILACDYPFVNGDLFVRLAEIATSAADDDIAAIVPVQADGQIQPLCAVYRTKVCLREAKKLMRSGEIPPARQLAENVKTRFVRFEELTDLRGAEFLFTNVNTPEEYLEAQDIFRRMIDEQPIT